MDLKRIYETNPDFRRYVDRYSKKHNLPAGEVLRHQLVKEYGELCEENEKLKEKEENV